MTGPTSEGNTNPEAKPVESDATLFSDVEEGSESVTESSNAPGGTFAKKGLLASILVVVIILGLVGYFLVLRGNSNAGDLAKIQGTVALSEHELRDVVSVNHLTAYWAGPVAGDKYTLLATSPGLVYVRYLPGGVGATDKKTQFRVIGTYVKKSAFAVGQYTGSLYGNVGMINGDGNSVFYSTSRATNVYVGLKGKDIQIEVFDPVPGQALGLALIQNQIRQIA